MQRSAESARFDLQPLLQQLTVGAAQPMFSPDDWALRLADVPYGQEFMSQLYAEWFPADPPDEFCAQLLEICQERIGKWHSGWPNLWAHTLRVIGYALMAAPDAGVAPEQAFALAVLHDVGKLDEMRIGELHEVIAAQAARELLKVHFSRPIVNAIAAAVGKDGLVGSPFTRLLFDIDKLDKIGATGIVRRVSQTIDLSGVVPMLRRVETDLNTFPSLNHDSTRQLATRKRAFTTQFLATMRADLE